MVPRGNQPNGHRGSSKLDKDGTYREYEPRTRKSLQVEQLKLLKVKGVPIHIKKRVLDIYSSLTPEAAPEESPTESDKGRTQDLPAPTDRTTPPLVDLEDYNMNEDTVVYISPETYLNELNMDSRIRGGAGRR